MAKALILCSRDRSTTDPQLFAQALSERVKPDNAVVTSPYIYQHEGLFTYIYNPAPTIEYEEASLCLGLMADFSSKTFVPRSPRPDGAFALFRVDENFLEIMSDYAASRSIWYYMTEQFFLASTSQRMIVSFLGDFIPNEKAFCWMLCSGTLGPSLSWDARIQSLPPNSSALLDRTRWQLSVQDCSSSLEYAEVSHPKHEHKSILAKAVKDAVSGLRINPSQWTLAISGGYDSRSLLHHLRDEKELNTITWGLRKSLGASGTDATIAAKLANICGMHHNYFPLDVDNNDFSTTIDRFLSAGEGRQDHLPGYMDGLKTWNFMSSSGRGLIRGYDPHGRKPPVSNEFQARRSGWLIVTKDVKGVEIPEEYSLSEKDIPLSLARKPGESLNDWRNRLWLQCRTPLLTAAFNDLFSAYVEVIDPLLCRNVVAATQAFPNHLLTDKTLWREIVSEMFPHVPFSRKDSTQDCEDILDIGTIPSILADEMLAAVGTGILKDDFLGGIATNLASGSLRLSIRRKLVRFAKSSLPMVAENYLRKGLNYEPLSVRRLALRAMIIVRMNKLLAEDARVGLKALKGDGIK